MAVAVSRAGATVTVTVTLDVSDLAGVSLTQQQRKHTVFERTQAAIQDALRANLLADSDLDADLATKHAEIARIKAGRASGNA